jgi:hypothetical protein
MSARTSWKGMIQRCTNERHPNFARYGGRGITVADRWRSFDAFLDDMGEAPVGATLDRIDNDRGYEPGNCQWATRMEQAKNRGVSRLVMWEGERIPLAELERRTGVNRTTLRDRIFGKGLSPKAAVSLPVDERFRPGPRNRSRNVSRGRR